VAPPEPVVATGGPTADAGGAGGGARVVVIEARGSRAGIGGLLTDSGHRGGSCACTTTLEPPFCCRELEAIFGLRSSVCRAVVHWASTRILPSKTGRPGVSRKEGGEKGGGENGWTGTGEAPNDHVGVKTANVSLLR